MNYHILAGDYIYYDPGSSGGMIVPVRVEEVGREWIHLKNGLKARRRNLQVYSKKNELAGRCFLSQEEAREQAQIFNAWNEFRSVLNDFGEIPPAGVSVTLLDHIRALLTLPPRVE